MRKNAVYLSMLFGALGFLVYGFMLSDISQVLAGFRKILFSSDILITDYMEIAGVGPAIINASIVTLCSIGLLYYNRVEAGGYTVAVVGLMFGFSLFGKNIFNIWFILLGSYLYTKVVRKPFSEYLCIGLLSTALSPIISFVFFKDGLLMMNVLVAIVLGVSIGFVVPVLAAFTKTIHKGYILYNVGFACGLLALVIVPIMKSYGVILSSLSFWSVGNNPLFVPPLYLGCILLVLLGLVLDKRVFKRYGELLKSSGKCPCDFIKRYGKAPVLVNMGVNGIIATSYILLIGGDFNGPTLGGIFSIMAFSAYGKHPRNMIPVIMGVVLGGVTKQFALTDPSIQIAALFSTTLAPLAGAFGPWVGILSGFIHSSVVLHAGGGYSGMNLYNNGYAGGIVFLVIFPLVSALRKKPLSQDS